MSSIGYKTLVVSLLLTVFFCKTTLYAQILFQDDFERTTLGNQWTILDDVSPQSGPSSWFIENGYLRQTANIWSYPDEARETKYHLGTKVITGSEEWQNYTLNALVSSKDNDGLGLIAHYQNEQNYYRLLLMNDPSWAGVDENGVKIGQPIQRLQKFVEGEPITLAENRVNSAYPATWFSLTLQVKVDSLIGFLNGERILSAVDSSFTNGKVGLLSYANSDLRYDSVLVTTSHSVYEEPERAIQYNFQRIVDRAPYIQLPEQNSVQIAWRTTEAGLGRVYVGTDKDELNRVYTENEANQKHLVLVDSLLPNTKYFYSVYTDDKQTLELASFVTKPELTEAEFSFFLLGDSGVNTPTQYKVSEQMWAEFQRNPVDFMVHVGDLHQGNGDGYDDVYFKPYQKLLQHFNVFTAIGNHDTYTLNATPYLESFYLPSNNPQNTERYYSFRWGKAFFINLDTNIDYSPDSPQYAFLIDQLNSDERKSATWTFVYAHHPPYSEYWVNYDGEPNVRNYLLPLFEEYQVDLVMNGHTHSYERGEKEHVHYLVSGGGGGSLDDYFVDHPHISVSEKKFHFTRVDVRNQQMRITAIDENGAVFDREEFSKRFTTFVQEKAEVPKKSYLSQNYPNPFNPTTTIQFSIEKAAVVRLELVDSLGKVVRMLQADKRFSAGKHDITLDATQLPTGVYTYRIFINGILSESRKLTFLK